MEIGRDLLPERRRRSSPPWAVGCKYLLGEKLLVLPWVFDCAFTLSIAIKPHNMRPMVGGQTKSLAKMLCESVRSRGIDRHQRWGYALLRRTTRTECVGELKIDMLKRVMCEKNASRIIERRDER